MPIVIRYSVHARSGHHFNDPRRVAGYVTRTNWVPFQQMMPTGRTVLAPDGRGNFVPVPQMMMQTVMVPQNYQVLGWVVQGTTTEWDDTAISRQGMHSYFPANTNLGGVQAIVTPYMTAFLTAGRAAGTTDVPAGTYSIRVAWLPDDDTQGNEGFTISQMYPR